MSKINYVDLAIKDPKLKEEIFHAIDRILTSGQYILGEEVEKFELDLCKYLNCKYVVGLNSGTDALFLALKAFDIQAGDEVIVPPNSFLATASTVIAAGATPIFADICEDLNIDPEQIEKKITKKTKAIIPVHLTGKAAKMNPILEIAKKYNLKVIEDAAQAIGTEYYSKKVGTLGDVGCFSLHPLKTLNACGDAGFITTNDESLYIKFKQLRNIGLKNRNESDFWGYNSRLDSLQAAILRVKLKYLDSWIETRRKNAKLYAHDLKDLVTIPYEEKYEKHTFHVYVIQTQNREGLQKFLEDNGIETKIHYPIPIHLQKCAAHLGNKIGDFPITESKARQILSLPINQNLKVDEIHFITSKIKSFLEQHKVKIKSIKSSCLA